MRKPTRVLSTLAVLGVLLTAVACAPMAPPRTTTVESVDVERYLGTWYELGSVKQFFSVGLVNTAAEYSLRGDGSIRVENSGRYFSAEGPESRIVGTALPVDASNAKLNVTFFGSAAATPPGNYWVVDLDPDYRWAIVSDPTGASGFILSRTRSVTDEVYADLYERARSAGVDVQNLTRTPQL